MNAMEWNEQESIALEFVVVRGSYERLGGVQSEVRGYMGEVANEMECSGMEGTNEGSPAKDREPAVKLTQ
ncbi:MAG TPA: hypothetical protein VE978_22960 [Chitinophagales bacterium]|nr:hypothetical protein [Chitinophagales bacterium]